MKKYQTSKIKSIKKLDEKYDRYDLTVGETSNFFANGILIHNTSAVFSRVLCYQQKNWWQKLLGISHERLEKEYRNIYSSRTVIKTRRDGKFTDDVWGVWARELFNKSKVEDGYTVYAEIAGYISHSKMVQKNYDYGFKPNENGLLVYRITHVDENGNVRELSFKEIQEYCAKHDLKIVPVYYQGKAKDLFPEIGVNDEWNKNFLARLSETYLEGDCEFCKNKVPSEGIVIRNESNERKPALKLKSFRFTLKESEARDKGESNMEEES